MTKSHKYIYSAIALLTAVVLLAPGCSAKRESIPPNLATTQAFLDGQELDIAGQMVSMLEGNVSALTIVGHNETADLGTYSGLITFVYDDEGTLYDIRANILYKATSSTDTKIDYLEVGIVKEQ